MAMNGIKGFYLLLEKKKNELCKDARRGKSGYSSKVVAESRLWWRPEGPGSAEVVIETRHWSWTVLWLHLGSAMDQIDTQAIFLQLSSSAKWELYFVPSGWLWEWECGPAHGWNHNCYEFSPLWWLPVAHPKVHVLKMFTYSFFLPTHLLHS